jgi:hypothetical protein
MRTALFSNPEALLSMTAALFSMAEALLVVAGFESPSR